MNSAGRELPQAVMKGDRLKAVAILAISRDSRRHWPEAEQAADCRAQPLPMGESGRSELVFESLCEDAFEDEQVTRDVAVHPKGARRPVDLHGLLISKPIVAPRSSNDLRRRSRMFVGWEDARKCDCMLVAEPAGPSVFEMIEMTSAPKRHQWWPVCHSRLWTDAEGCITTITAAGRVRRTNPVNTAVIGHYNSVRLPDGGRDPALEIFFAEEIESPVAPVLARLATETRRDLKLEARFDKALLRRECRGIREDGFVPDERAFSASFGPEDQRALAHYVASLIVRVPSYKDELNSDRMLENVAAVLGVEAGPARYATDRLHVEIVRRHLEDYAARLMSCAFVLIDAPEGDQFIIGDTPVIPAALGFGTAEAMCPVSPTRALIIISGWRPPYPNRIAIFRSQRKSVRAFNKTMVQNAEREVFCRTAVPAAWVTRHLGTRQVRLAPNIETAAGAHSAHGPMLDRASARR